MTNTKKRRKLLWGMRMMMRDIKLIHGWHEPLLTHSILKCIDDFARDGGGTPYVG